MIQTPLFLLRLENCTYEFVRAGGLLVGRTMVTQAMWEEVMGYNPSNYIGPQIPVDNVSYQDVQEFLRKLHDLTSLSFGHEVNFCLMSETEWNDVATDSFTVYRDSEIVTNAGLASGFQKLTIWSAENSNQQPHPVAMNPPDENGLYDMYGNLWEICAVRPDREPGSATVSTPPRREDFNDALDYKRAELKYRLLRSHVVEMPLEIVLKGGAWNMSRQQCTKHSRIVVGEQDRFANAGFRICVEIESE